jgi:plasmid rolling circle replication initiator protein Rep
MRTVIARPTDFIGLPPEEQHFDRLKLNSRDVALLLDVLAMKGYTLTTWNGKVLSPADYCSSIFTCGDVLEFETNGVKRKLVAVWFCRKPVCPMCNQRRSLKQFATLMALKPQIQELYPSYRWAFLTLTQKNVPIGELRETIQHMNDSWRRLVKIKGFPFEGWFKKIEVTREWDCYNRGRLVQGIHGIKEIDRWERERDRKLELKPTEMVHPHLHVLGLVAPGYFGGTMYWSQKRFSETWKAAGRYDYTPIVDIRAVKAKKLPPSERIIGDAPRQYDATDKAILEVTKYLIKAEELSGRRCDNLEANAIFLGKFTEQMYACRRLTAGGTLRKLDTALDTTEKDDNLLHIRNEDKETLTGDIEREIYRWMNEFEEYALHAKVSYSQSSEQTIESDEISH